MVIQLTDAQRAVLEPACQLEDLCIYPVRAPLKGVPLVTSARACSSEGCWRRPPRRMLKPSGATTKPQGSSPCE
jgi:hypothetical protein